ncbi:MAG: hypothetical protein QOI74_2405, partial [Micromonosporaceae bacterium]|nr:hypothetical protein [Micromonosporaceae bacterium]
QPMGQTPAGGAQQHHLCQPMIPEHRRKPMVFRSRTGALAALISARWRTTKRRQPRVSVSTRRIPRPGRPSRRIRTSRRRLRRPSVPHPVRCPRPPSSRRARSPNPSRDVGPPAQASPRARTHQRRPPGQPRRRPGHPRHPPSPRHRRPSHRNRPPAHPHHPSRHPHHRSRHLHRPPRRPHCPRRPRRRLNHRNGRGPSGLPAHRDLLGRPQPPNTSGRHRPKRPNG